MFAGVLLSAHPAQAREDHKQSITTVSSSLGFGPTAPGVSAIVIDARSGQVISDIGADVPRYPASLTKLMTLDLAFQALRAGKISLDMPLPVSEHAADVEPVKLGLRPGGIITVRDAILAMTTMSANDAATTLGEYLGGGSEYHCAELMTARAHALGMAQTSFANASGLPNPNQVTTARDLAILARDIVINYPEYQQFFEVQKFDLDGHTIYSNNNMLKTYPGATGMKTGYTTLGRHNLITSAERNGRILIGVALHEPSWGSTYNQMTNMLDAGFAQVPFHPVPNTVVASNQPPAMAPAHASSGLITAADAATIRPVITHPAPPHPKPAAANQLASNDNSTGWTAELGSYKQMSAARSKALSVRQMRGVGIVRVARLDVHGKILWTAQLTGLSHEAAHSTCTALAAKRAACVIIPPQSDHLAARNTSDG
ncbi:MAG TPA: D-alanyl-D-alanine carboxypeptidase family protein [Acidocella sp.]|nr:D-alanyl-D-alanine carboxypeptidase family protein [Acidocella sp.]